MQCIAVHHGTACEGRMACMETGGSRHAHQKCRGQVAVLGEAEPKVALDAVRRLRLGGGPPIHAIAGDDTCAMGKVP